MIEKKWNSIKKKILTALAEEEERKRLLFITINVLLAIVAFTMTVVNAFTGEIALFFATLLFTIICGINATLVYLKMRIEKILNVVFSIESLVLIAFFAVSGIPDGFSIQWICLIPGFAFLIFTTSFALRFSVVAFVMLAFLFWTGAGQSLLMYEYNPTFMLRFPFYYLAILLISFIADQVKMGIQKQLEDTQGKYYYLYRHDNLTGLYNRFGIKDYIDAAINFENSDKIGVLIMDIDDFKWVNDTYGHQCGDEVLKTIANVPLKLLCPHAKICRWGGEEFLIIMGCDDDPVELAERIRKEIEETAVEFEGKSINVTVSIGVAISTSTHREGSTAIIEKADKALYVSKTRGKNCVTLY